MVGMGEMKKLNLCEVCSTLAKMDNGFRVGILVQMVERANLGL